MTCPECEMKQFSEEDDESSPILKLGTLQYRKIVCCLCGKVLGSSPIEITLAFCEEHTPKG